MYFFILKSPQESPLDTGTAPVLQLNRVVSSAGTDHCRLCDCTIRDGLPNEEFKRAYRRQELRYQPDKNKEPGSEEKFKEIAKAYDMLSDPRKREIFDCYRKEGWKGSGPSGGSSGGANGTSFSYTFHGDPHAMFAEFFSGRNPFDTLFGQLNGEQGMDMDDAFSGLPMGMGGFTNINFSCSRPAQEPTRKKQDPPITHDLRVSLEEIYSG
ncbi:hypothetical protein MC885_008950 [Smutsia gigantea]|nr:hypothetical protein MC885_008950 [Smutsia gigantea]